MILKWDRINRAEYTAGGTRYHYRVFLAFGKKGWQVAEEDMVHDDTVLTQTACEELEDAQALAQEWEDIEARNAATNNG